jgi:hypothetical protein
MVIVLRYHDVGEEPGPGAAAGYCVIGRRCRHDGIASPARQLLADVPDHLEAAGHVIECLGDLLADPAQRATAGRAAARRGMDHVLARQVFRQRTSCRLLCFHRPLGRCGHHGRGSGEPLGLVGFQRLDRQLELLGLARQLLRRATELGAAIAGQLEAQLGDLRLCGDRIVNAE